MKIGTIPCRKSREGSAPCSNEALAHATILGLRAWYSGNRAPACPCRGQGPLGTGNKKREGGQEGGRGKEKREGHARIGQIYLKGGTHAATGLGIISVVQTGGSTAFGATSEREEP